MANRANPRVGPTCMRPAESCHACAEKLPRYLCFRALVSLADSGTGTGTGTGTGSSNLCCDEINARLTPGAGGGCGWHVSGLSCLGGTGLLGSVTVEVLKHATGSGSGTGTGTGPDCFTRVTVAADVEHVFEFEGVLPIRMSFVVTRAGVTFVCSIRTADVAVNPRAFDKCAICACVTAIPKSLCVSLEITNPSLMPSLPCGSSTAAAIAAWDCESERWITPEMTLSSVTYSVFLRMATVDDGVGCAIIGKVKGHHVNDTFVISLESGATGTSYHGYQCAENSDFVTRGSSPLANIDLTTVIDYSTIINSTTGTGTGSGSGSGSGAPIGTLRIRDLSCGGNCNPPAVSRCNGACPELLFPETWCDPVNIFAEIVAPGCLIDGFGWTMTSGSNWLETLRPGPTPPTQGSCSDFSSNPLGSGITVPTTKCGSPAEYTITSNLYYFRKACTSDIVDMSRYHLGIDVRGMCTTLYGGASYSDLRPAEGATCNPFQMDFPFDISILQANPGGEGSPGGCDCCAGTGTGSLTSPAFIRLTL